MNARSRFDWFSYPYRFGVVLVQLPLHIHCNHLYSKCLLLALIRKMAQKFFHLDVLHKTKQSLMSSKSISRENLSFRHVEHFDKSTSRLMNTLQQVYGLLFALLQVHRLVFLFFNPLKNSILFDTFYSGYCSKAHALTIHTNNFITN
jgi:hypothetical protein